MKLISDIISDNVNSRYLLYFKNIFINKIFVFTIISWYYGELTYLPNLDKRTYTDRLNIILGIHTFLLLHQPHHTIVIKRGLSDLSYKIPIIKLPKLN